MLLSFIMPYYGELRCAAIIKSGTEKGTQCTNSAYYEKDGKYLCGRHSSNPRITLPKNPNAKLIKAQQINDHKEGCKQAAEANKKNGIKGDITVDKMIMMKEPKTIPTYIKIFPNYKHKDRKDGIGMPELSPKSLGPIDHKMPGLPIAKNLENFHQFAKVFQCDMENNKVTDKAKAARIIGYNDSIPHRHKYDSEILKKLNNNINVPNFSVYYDKNCNEHRYNYIQCRYFYCHWYEILVVHLSQFKLLKNMLSNGYNIQIIGYDGYSPGNDLMAHYLDSSRPFGHELVLYTMLKIDNSGDYPWNKYYDDNRNIYKDVI